MSQDTSARGGDIVSQASKMVRCLLILPLLALLLPGKSCDAFQLHRLPASTARTHSTGFDQHVSRTRMLSDAIRAATPNNNSFWSSTYKSRFLTSQLAAAESESDDGDDIDEKIEKLKLEAESKKASAEAEAKRLKAEAEKAAKLKAEQDKKLKEAQEMLAQIQAEAEARKKFEEETAKQQAAAEEKQKQAEEEAAKLKAEAEAKEEKRRLKAQKRAEEEAAKQKAEEEKRKLKAKKKAEELTTLLKAKEEAARVMAEIDAKLQAQTAEEDEEEAKSVQKLQSDAEQMPDLDDETDEMLKKMMEEMEKVKIELDARLEAEAKEAAAKAKVEEEVRAKKAEEEAIEEEAAVKAESQENTKVGLEEETSAETADLMDRIKSGANFDPVAKTVEAEQVKEIPTFISKPKEEPIDTTASAKAKSSDDETAKDEGEKESEPVTKNSDPRTKGRSRKENLFDVIGRTASGGVTMDEITRRKKKQPQSTSEPLPAEVVKEMKKKGPPDSFGQSVAESYRTNNQGKEESQRVMPDLTNMKELKKKGPPASFGSYAAAASSKGSPPTNDESDTVDSMDKGPPASFGASVAMASSGEVPKDLLSRGTASTDASPPPPKQPTASRKRGPDNNIIDVVDVEYTKKDEPKAPPLEVEKTVPQAPPLQVEKTVPPMKNPPKKKENSDVVAEKKTSNPIKNIGKAAVEKIIGQKKVEPEENATPKLDEKDDGKKEKGMEDRVAELLKEAFSLSKEDSRVADLLQGVVAITTGKDDKKEKEEKRSRKRINLKGRKKKTTVAEEEEIEDEEEDDDYEEVEEDVDDYEEDFDDEEEEDSVIMGGRNRRVDDRNDFGRNTNRRGPPNGGMGNNRFMEDTRRPGPFGDTDRDGYFEDNDEDYFEYDDNDRWRGRGPGSRRAEPGGYSVRPPPQSRGDPRSETDDDYYFLQFGSPSSRYDEPRGSRYDEPRGSRYDEPRGDGYYGDQDDYYYDDDYDGPQPGAPRPAYVEPEEDVPKGPPASFGNFVANASMDKTGYAPSSMKDNNFGGGVNGGSSGGGFGPPGEEYGEEMSQSTGSMLTPRGVKVNGSGGKPASSKPLFVVSEDQSDSGGRKKGPPSSFGKSVAEAGEQQTGYPTRSVEEEIANGGMATPTGSMATPRRKTPVNPSAGGGNPSGGAGRPKKPLFIVSEEDDGSPADFGSSVAEASGSKTGWAPKTPKRATGGLEGGTLGGMRPKIKKKSTPQPQPKKEFGDSVFEDCPPVESKKKKSQGDLPLTRKQSVDTDMNQKHQRNPAVKLVDGGASKNPPRQVRFGGSMMAPRIRKEPPTPPAGIEGDSLEDGEGKK